MQDALIWTGDYVGLVNGTLGARTRDAVAAYLKRNGASPTAAFDAAARARLLADARARRQAVGFAPVQDKRAGVAMSLPTKLLPKETGTDSGTRFASADGDLVVDTLSRPAPAGGLPEIFARMSAAAGTRKVTYKLLRPDFFVVSPARSATGLSTRASRPARTTATDVVRGFTISYPKAAAPRLDPDDAGRCGLLRTLSGRQTSGGREACQLPWPTLPCRRPLNGRGPAQVDRCGSGRS